MILDQYVNVGSSQVILLVVQSHCAKIFVDVAILDVCDRAGAGNHPDEQPQVWSWTYEDAGQEQDRDLSSGQGIPEERLSVAILDSVV